MTLLRVFVNQDTTHMYHLMFQHVFNIIAAITKQSNSWQHLTGKGFGAIVMDMDGKQMQGKILIIHYE